MSGTAQQIDLAMARFNARVTEPRAWGINDCCVAVADFLAPIWGADPMARFRGRYSSQRGFLRVVRNEDCKTLAEAVALGAADAGAELLPEGKPADFDLGMIAIAEAEMGVDGRRTGERVPLGMPAFFFSGTWRGLSPAGLAASTEALLVWRHPAMEAINANRS